MVKPVRYTEEMIQENLKKGYWKLPTVSEQMDRNAKLYPDKEALMDSRTRLTFAQAKLWMDRLALGLIESGVERDQVVFIQLPNCVEQYLLRFACEKAGIRHLPVRRSMGLIEAEHLIKNSDAVGAIIPWKYHDRDHFAEIQNLRSKLPLLKNIYVWNGEVPQGAISIKEMLKKELEKKYPPDFLEKRSLKGPEVAHLYHTTGTTGLPKIVDYLAVNRPIHGTGLMKMFKITKDDVITLFSPANLGPNAGAYFSAPYAACKVVMIEDLDAERALQVIDKEKVTVLGGSPTMLTMLVRHQNFRKYDHSSVRAIISTGAPLQYAIGQEVEAAFGVPVCNGYGITDSGASFYNDPNDSQELRLTTVGKPIGWAQARVRGENGQLLPAGEIGEVELTGPSSCDGYLTDAEATKAAWTADGWYKTGDLGKLDEKGYLRLVGRSKDLIVRGGDKVAPSDVEAYLITHPSVAAVSVVGMPDSLMGQRVCAFVVLKPGKELTFQEIVSFLRKKGVTPYKLPERLEIIDKIPMRGEEKPDKKTLVERITEKLKAEGKI